MKFSWSFSVLDMFRTCRKKYYHLKVTRDVKDSDNVYAAEGKLVHKAMFERVVNGKPLPINLRQHEKIASRFAEAKGDKHGEIQLCLNEKLEPKSWFAKDAWVRAIIDLLVINGSKAVIVDWKTGKRKDQFDQLRLSAAILSRYMPEIEEFKLVFVWLKNGELTPPQTIKKEQIRAVWLEFFPEVKEIKAAIKTTSFPASPSGLCGYCPVHHCPHNKN